MTLGFLLFLKHKQPHVYMTKHPRIHQHPEHHTFLSLSFSLTPISGGSCASNKQARGAGQPLQAHVILHQEFQASSCPRTESIPRCEASEGEVHDQAPV